MNLGGVIFEMHPLKTRENKVTLIIQWIIIHVEAHNRQTLDSFM